MKKIPFNLISKLKFAVRILTKDYEVTRANASNHIKFLGIAWCDPKNIETSTRYFVEKHGGYLNSNLELPKESFQKNLSRFIVDGNWDYDTTSIDDVTHISRTIRRYEKNLSWEAVGEIDWMMRNIRKFGVQDDCRSYEDVIKRCNNLDALKKHLETKGKFATQQELNPLNFREMGGIGVGIGRKGDIIWFDNGAHRLAIARHLRLPEIPVCLQLVHADAIKSGDILKYLTTTPKFR